METLIQSNGLAPIKISLSKVDAFDEMPNLSINLSFYGIKKGDRKSKYQSKELGRGLKPAGLVVNTTRLEGAPEAVQTCQAVLEGYVNEARAYLATFKDVTRAALYFYEFQRRDDGATCTTIMPIHAMRLEMGA